MKHKYLDLIAAVFVTTIIVSNIVASKIGAFGPWFMPVGVIIFPVAYILSDVLTEVYGYGAMRRVIWIGFFCNLIAVAAYFIARHVPSAPFYQDQAAFDAIFGATPRLLLASFVAYLIGSFMNAAIMAKMKIKTKGRYLWMRTIGSTVVGEGVDSAVFITIAFSGVFGREQIISLMLTQWAFKCAFEIVVTPVTYWIVASLKKSERTDHYDYETNFFPLHF